MLPMHASIGSSKLPMRGSNSSVCIHHSIRDRALATDAWRHAEMARVADVTRPHPERVWCGESPAHSPHFLR
jgi:hypothetical protein